MDEQFDAVYGAYSAMVYWTAYGLTRDRDAAADMTQSTFLRAYENWDTLAKLHAAEQRGWLYKTCRNLALNQLKRDRRLAFPGEIPEPCATGAPGMEEVLEEKELTRLIWHRIELLPTPYREPVILHYFAELSTGEAARALRVPHGTYRSRLSRARSLLEKMLESEVMTYE